MFSALTNRITRKNYAKENNEWIKKNWKESKEVLKVKSQVKKVVKEIKDTVQHSGNYQIIHINDDFVVV